jgi:hypothetical protein
MAAGMAATQGLNNLSSGLLSLVNDDYDQVNQQGQQRSAAISQASPLAGLFQYAPQAAAGVATAGLGTVPAVGTEALLGAATTPQDPWTGAAFGGAAAALPGIGGALWGQGRKLAGRWGGSVADDGMLPGVPRPNTAAADAMEGIEPRFPETPPDPMTLLRQRAAELDAQEAAARGGRGRTAAQGPGSRGGDEGDFIEGPPGDPLGASADANPPAPPPRMADRVTQAIDNADRSSNVANVRVYGDLMTPDELAEYGIGTTKGQNAALMSTTGDPAGARAARAALREESALTSSPALGRRIRDTHAQQQEATTNFINHQLGIPEGAAITDGTLSEVISGVGLRFDEIANEMGGVPITKEIRDELAEVMRLSSDRHTPGLQQTIDLALQKADLHGGMLDGQQWQAMRTDLTKQIDKAMRDGKMPWLNEASDVMGIFAKAMEGSLPTASKVELRKLRKQYAIAATLAKAGSRNPDGMINPTSFYGKWKAGQSLKTRGKDDVGRFLNTMNFLTQRRTPDSGTAGRLGMMVEDAVHSVPGIGPIIKGLTQ